MTIQLAQIFRNNMVFQANKPIYIFGKATPLSTIEIEILNKHYEFTVEKEDFCFELVALPITKVAFDVLIQSNDQKIILSNCLVGDVYLCTGQSNMQYVCKDVINVEYKELPNLRLYEVPKLPYFGAEKEFDWLYTNDPQWQIATLESEKTFSAIGYMLGKDIVINHDIPVGIISCNQGDTTIYSWLSKETIANNQVLKPYLDTYNEWENEYENYDEFSKKYNEQVPKLMEFWGLLDQFRSEGFSSEEVYEKAHKIIPYPYLPMGPKNQNRPAGCYDTLLKTIIPFSNNGIIYYQGENDVSRADEYKVAIAELINLWQKDFRDESIFINCQIAGHIYSETPDLEVAKLRDAQASIIDIEQLRFVTTAIDYGEESNIHPVNKTEVAKRIYKIIDQYIYQGGEDSLSPMFDYYMKSQEEIQIYTKYNQQDLIIKDAKVSGFYGVTKDDCFKEIDQVKVDKNKIVISDITPYKEIRYGYSAFPNLSIYTRNGLPLLPFRLMIKD